MLKTLREELLKNLGTLLRKKSFHSKNFERFFTTKKKEKFELHAPERS